MKSNDYSEQIELEYLLLTFNYSRSRFLVIDKNADFVCQYINRIHTKRSLNLLLSMLRFFFA